MKQLSELSPEQLTNFKNAYAAYAVEQMDVSTMERIIAESLAEGLEDCTTVDIQQQACNIMGEELYTATFDAVSAVTE